MRQTFIEKLHECNLHKQRLLGAKSHLRPIMPLDVDRYAAIDDVQMGFVDQMIFRFSKLQDTLGEKIFPALLALHGEPVKKMTFIDRLNRLEELELVDKNVWMGLRKARNEVAHEYSFNQEEVVDGINLIFDRVDLLLNIYRKIYDHCFDRFEFVRHSAILKRDEENEASKMR